MNIITVSISYISGKCFFIISFNFILFIVEVILSNKTNPKIDISFKSCNKYQQWLSALCNWMTIGLWSLNINSLSCSDFLDRWELTDTLGWNLCRCETIFLHLFHLSQVCTALVCCLCFTYTVSLYILWQFGSNLKLMSSFYYWDK